MKIPTHALAPLVTKKKNSRNNRPRSKERQACDAKGLALRTVQQRMETQGITFEEALAQPKAEKSAAGRKGRMNSPWKEGLPADEIQAKKKYMRENRTFTENEERRK